VSLRGRAPVTGPFAHDLGAAATASDSLRLADLSTGLRLRTRALDVSGALGVRVGDFAGLWGSIASTWQIAPRVALEASGGRYPRDLTGFTDGLFAQAGLRVSTRAPLRLSRGAVDVQRRNGQVRLVMRYDHPVAALAIVGDWNAWTPQALTRDGHGRWSIAVPLPAGVYHYALVADGEWTLPDGEIAVDDGFGGRVGVLVVRR
jgi:hypothetical protein